MGRGEAADARPGGDAVRVKNNDRGTTTSREGKVAVLLLAALLPVRARPGQVLGRTGVFQNSVAPTLKRRPLAMAKVCLSASLSNVCCANKWTSESMSDLSG